MFVLHVTEFLVTEAHLVVVGVVQHAARHEGLAGHEGCGFGNVLNSAQHPDVALHGVRAEVPQSCEKSHENQLVLFNNYKR